MFCTKCGHSINPGNNFCTECGQVLKAGLSSSIQSSHQPFAEYSSQKKPAFNYTVFLKKYMWWLIIPLLVLASVITVYKMFFEPDPVKDAQVIVKLRCNCQNKHDDDLYSTLTRFKTAFIPSAYRTRKDAENKLGGLRLPYENALYECINYAGAKADELKGRYSGNYKKVAVFENIIAQANCARLREGEINSMESEISSLINQIKEPDPDESAIKEKLIGKNVPGWNFESLSDFQSVIIKNSIRTETMIEITADITMANATSTKTYAYNDILLAFVMNDEGEWYLDNIITGTYTWNITVGNTWVKVELPPHVNYNIDTHGSRGWVKDDSWWPTNYKIGPDGDRLNLHSATISLASREPNQDIAITLIMTKQ